MNTQTHLKYIALTVLLIVGITIAHEVSADQADGEPVGIIVGLPEDLYNQGTKREEICEMLNWPDAGWKKVCATNNYTKIYYLYDVTETQIKMEMTPEEKIRLKAIFNDSRARFERNMTISDALEEYGFMYYDEISE